MPLMSKTSKRWRDATAKSLLEARSLPKGSYRDIVISTADAYKYLAEIEERRTSNLERSQKRRPSE
jgi:hypothetical protein